MPTTKHAAEKPHAPTNHAKAKEPEPEKLPETPEQRAQREKDAAYKALSPQDREAEDCARLVEAFASNVADVRPSDHFTNLATKIRSRIGSKRA